MVKIKIKAFDFFLKKYHLINKRYDNEPNVIDMWSDSMASGCQEYGTVF